MFVQDDWHIRPNLTLNLGLRWEKATPTTESHNRQTIGFDAAATNQVTQAAEAAYAKSPIAQLPVSQFLPTGGLLFAIGSNRDPYTTSNKAFAPRVGVAWSPDALHEQTVIRSGIGIFNYNYGTVTPNQQGFSAIDHLCHYQQQLSDARHHAEQSLPHGDFATARQFSGHQHVPGPERHGFQSALCRRIQPALEFRHPAPAFAEYCPLKSPTSATIRSISPPVTISVLSRHSI